MQTLRDMMILAYGTSEGVRKEWDSRGRGQKDEHSEENCSGPNCKDEITYPKSSHEDKAIVIPHLDGLELQMNSTKAGQNIHFDKEALKSILRMTLAQLDMEDHSINYMNSDVSGGTDHYIKINFNRISQEIHGSKQ